MWQQRLPGNTKQPNVLVDKRFFQQRGQHVFHAGNSGVRFATVSYPCHSPATLCQKLQTLCYSSEEVLQCSAEESAFDLECADIVERDLADADLQDEVQETALRS